MSPGKFKELKAYLQALPEALPLSSPTSKLNKLLDFSLDIFSFDEDWLSDVGVEGAINRVGVRRFQRWQIIWSSVALISLMKRYVKHEMAYIFQITKPIPGDSSEASNSKLVGYTWNDTANSVICEKKCQPCK